MQLKIAVIVAIRYVFRGCRYGKNAFTAEVPSRTTLAELTALSQTLSCCLLLYLNIAGLRQGPEKMLLGA